MGDLRSVTMELLAILNGRRLPFGNPPLSLYPAARRSDVTP
jgi:hypothetical protein